MNTLYTSDGNTYLYTHFEADGTFDGTYDDTSGYELVRVWAMSPNGALKIYIHYADSSGGDADIEEYYSVFKNHMSTISSLKKKRWMRTEVINAESIDVSNVRFTTKFVRRNPQPTISYTSDDVVANVSVDLDSLTINSTIDNSTHNILVYGATTDLVTGTHHAIRTDNCGSVVVVGSNGPVSISGAVMALTSTGAARSILDGAGYLAIRPLVSTDVITAQGPVGVGTSTAGHLPILLGGADGSGLARVAFVDSNGRLSVNVSGSIGVQALRPDGTSVSLLDSDGAVKVRPLLTTDHVSIQALRPDGTSVSLLDGDGAVKVRPLLTTDHVSIQALRPDGTSVSLLDTDGAVKVRPLTTADHVTSVGLAADGAGVSGNPLLVAGKSAGTGLCKSLLTDSTGQLQVTGAFVNTGTNTLNTRTLTTTDTVTVVGPQTSDTIAAAPKPLLVGGTDANARVRTVLVDADGALSVAPKRNSVSSMAIPSDGTQGTAPVPGTGLLTGLHVYNVSPDTVLYCLVSDDNGLSIKIPVAAHSSEYINLAGGPVSYQNLKAQGATDYAMSAFTTNSLLYGLFMYL